MRVFAEKAGGRRGRVLRCRYWVRATRDGGDKIGRVFALPLRRKILREMATSECADDSDEYSRGRFESFREKARI